jgi:DNA protecting protein DprA
LALSWVKGLGDSSIKSLIRTYEDLDAIWHTPPQQLSKLLTSTGLRSTDHVVDQILSQRVHLLDEGRRQLEQLERQRIALVLDTDNDYPAKLRDIEDPPRWLFVQGNLKILSIPNLIAVVGTRSASDQGIRRARCLTRWLAERGFGIVSGLAEGIDEVAHQTALDYGVPTIAILGTGINMVFPASTAIIRSQMVDSGGAIVTEYLPKDSYSRDRFVRRNRLQAGLAFATVPVEGQINGGTAHTYRFARDFGRITFGVANSSEPTPNGILELLRNDNRPIFDLDSPDSMTELEQLLRPAMVPLSTVSVTRPYFATLIREFERIVTSHPIADEDFKGLQYQLEEAWKRARNGSQGRSS